MKSNPLPLVNKKLFYLVTADHYHRKGAVQYTYARNASGRDRFIRAAQARAPALGGNATR